MNKFKDGDKVERILGVHGGMKEGDVSVVRLVYADFLILEDFEGSHCPENFKLASREVKYKNPPRIHRRADLYKEWLKGADIESRPLTSISGNWTRSINFPLTFNDFEYRIDPDCIITEISPRQLEIDKLKLQAQELLAQVDKLQSMDKGE